MTDTKHTKWTLLESMVDGQRSLSVMAGETRIAEIMVDPKRPKECVPLAHLIAAAPEMLEALESARCLMDWYKELVDTRDSSIAKANALKWTKQFMAEADAALAKARGETP